MAEQQHETTPSQPAPAESPDSAREGVSERGGEGGYGNDTGFATGTEAATDGQDEGGTSGREQQTSDTYRDAGQGGGTL